MSLPIITRALPIKPIRPMMPKNTGTTIETIRSSGHSVVSFVIWHIDRFVAIALVLLVHIAKFDALL